MGSHPAPVKRRIGRFTQGRRGRSAPLAQGPTATFRPIGCANRTVFGGDHTTPMGHLDRCRRPPGPEARRPNRPVALELGRRRRSAGQCCPQTPLSDQAFSPGGLRFGPDPENDPGFSGPSRRGHGHRRGRHHPRAEQRRTARRRLARRPAAAGVRLSRRLAGRVRSRHRGRTAPARTGHRRVSSGPCCRTWCTGPGRPAGSCPPARCGVWPR